MKLKYIYLSQPGKTWTEEKIHTRVSEYRELALTCLEEIPNYQCLKYSLENFKKLIIVEARDKNTDQLYGICSSLIIDIPNSEPALHLGLTLVSPAARGLGLTHQLTSRVVKNYMLRNSLLKPLWITNVACVISSLGNVALHFESVFPTPENYLKPTDKQTEIAHIIDQNYREHIYIPKTAKFNPRTFIFEESVKGTMFEKSKDDKNYHHRKHELTEFYSKYLNFERGDEVLQVGQISLLSYPKYKLKKWLKPLRELSKTAQIKT